MIPTATSSVSGLMSAAIFNQHVTNTAKVSNITHTGDVTDASGVLTVTKINNVSMAGLATGIVKNTTSTGAPSIAVAGDFPTLNQNTTGTAATATTATNLASGSVGSVPYQTAANTTAMLSAGTAGQFLKSNGAAAPVWGAVNMSTDLTGTLPVDKGGTGAAILSGILKGNGTNAFTAVTQPAGDLVGTTATQTLTNKTLGSGTDLGTPNSGTLTNCTGLPLTTGVSGTLLAGNGGTGQASYVIGDILYASSSTALSKLVNVATGNALLSGGVGVAPAYGKVGLTTHVSGTLLAGNGGTGQGSYGIGDILYASGSTTLSKLASGEANTVLRSTGLLTAPSYGQVDLTTDVTGTLPVANGGTGVAASAYGQIGGQTAGTSTAYTTTYAKLVINTSLDAAAEFDINGVNNRLRYTGSETRKFLVFASMDMFSATDGAQFSIKIAKNGTVINATQCNAVCPTKAGVGVAKLVSNWIIEFATNDYVEIFVASVGGAETGTPQRMRLVATPVF